MAEYGVIQYLLSAIENNYLEGLSFDKIEPSKILLTASVSDSQKIQPVIWMIEANMYINKDLMVKSTVSYKNYVEIHGFNRVTYVINVVAN